MNEVEDELRYQDEPSTPVQTKVNDGHPMSPNKHLVAMGN